MFTYLNGLIVENQSNITSLQEDLETLNDALDDYTIFEYGSTEPTGLTTTSNVIWLATTS